MCKKKQINISETGTFVEKKPYSFPVLAKVSGIENINVSIMLSDLLNVSVFAVFIAWYLAEIFSNNLLPSISQFLVHF